MERIYKALSEDAERDNGRNILLQCGMLEWLSAVGIKLINTATTGQAFRVKYVEKTSQDDLIVLLANIMMGEISYGL